MNIWTINGRLQQKLCLILRCLKCTKEVGVNLKEGYNGELTSRQAGSVGGQMVRKMIQAYEDGMK